MNAVEIAPVSNSIETNTVGFLASSKSPVNSKVWHWVLLNLALLAADPGTEREVAPFPPRAREAAFLLTQNGAKGEARARV